MRTIIIALLLLLQGAGRAPLANGVIAGQIRSTDGTPAVGVRVGAVAVPDNAATSAGAVTIAGLAETDNSGRFRLENLPAGRYYITAGPAAASSYFPGVRAEAEAQAVTLSPGGFLAGINFLLARPLGVRVSGRVTGAPAGLPSGIIRVTLLQQAPSTGSQLDAPLQADGTFEFARVTPGRYVARLMPPAGTANTAVQVDDQDVNLQMTMGTLLVGRVVMDDGSKLPVQNGMQGQPLQLALLLAAGALTSPATLANATAAGPDPMSFVQIRGLRSAGTAIVAGRGAVAQFQAQARADGYFTAPAAPGEYQISALVLPFGYYVKTVAIDPSTSQLLVTMTTTAPPTEPAGVKVSGRITGAGLAGARWVRLQTLAPNAAVATPGGIGAPLQRIGEAPIRDDGTFEMLRVPPGPFTMMVLSASNPVDIIVQMRLDVGDQDMSVDFTVTPARPATGPPGPSLVVPPPAPFTVTIP